MKPEATPELIALLQTNNFMVGDFYRFTLNDGVSQDFFSALDIPITFGGNVYKANSLRIEGMRFKLAIGLQVDEQTVRISARPGETLCGADFLSGAASGLLDGAYITRFKGFWQRATGNILSDYQATPIGVVELSNMLVSEITKIGRTHAEIAIKSPTKLLDLDMPRNYYSPGCIHTLFDGGCTLVKSSFGVNGIIGAGPTLQIIPWSGGVVASTGGDGLPNYAQGRLQFTSGLLSNLQVSVANNDSVNLFLTYPLQRLPSPDDTFTIFPGCSKTMDTCKNKFFNLLNFEGFPFVPAIYISL